MTLDGDLFTASGSLDLWTAGRPRNETATLAAAPPTVTPLCQPNGIAAPLYTALQRPPAWFKDVTRYLTNPAKYSHAIEFRW